MTEDIVTNDEHNMADLTDELIKVTVTVDDGCDWAAWIIWRMRMRSGIRSGEYEPEPERPQIVPPTITSKKKPTKKRRHAKEDGDE
jgi:hypothetical protein